MRTQDAARLLLLAAAWGGAFVFVRAAVPHFDAIGTALGRVLLGGRRLCGIKTGARCQDDSRVTIGANAAPAPSGDRGGNMLTFEDCVSLCELTREEIQAIAEHEHIPEMAAAELGNYLAHTPEGEPAIRDILVDDMRAAMSQGDLRRSATLKHVLRHFIERHPSAERRHTPR